MVRPTMKEDLKFVTTMSGAQSVMIILIIKKQKLFVGSSNFLSMVRRQ